MRIRKNTKLSSILLETSGYGGEKLETYVCHLNQSPWDVIPVTNLLDSSWFLPSPPQLDGEDSLNNGNENMSSGNYTQSVDRFKLVAAADNYERSPGVEEPMDYNDNSDKKSKSAEPNSPVKTSGDEEQVAVAMPAPPKRGRPRGTAKKASASTASLKNPYEFYYYSGFGPRWGRKRGSSGDEKVIMGDSEKSDESEKIKWSEEEEDYKTTPFGSDEIDNVGEENYELMDEDCDDDDDEKKKTITTTKKRGRKPVKERSLKSLM